MKGPSRPAECSDCSYNHPYSHKIRCAICGLHMHEEWCEAENNYPKVYYDDDYGKRWCIRCVQSPEFLEPFIDSPTRKRV